MAQLLASQRRDGLIRLVPANNISKGGDPSPHSNEALNLAKWSGPAPSK
jgi:hypothetical protein